MIDLLTLLAEDREIAEATMVSGQEWSASQSTSTADSRFVAATGPWHDQSKGDMLFPHFDAVFIARFSPDYVLKLIAVARWADKLSGYVKECYPGIRVTESLDEALHALAEHGEGA